MLTRAKSAPAHYGPAGILRYNPEPTSPSPSNVKFAPLPETEVFGRRAKFSSKLGVHGRSGILNKQRRNSNGINYNQNNAIKEPPESLSQEDATPSKGNDDAAHGSTSQQASEASNLQTPNANSSLHLRRSASEDGTVSTSTKRKSSLLFWKKASKQPSLSTIPSEAVLDTTASPQLPSTAASRSSLGKMPEAPAPFIQILTLSASDMETSALPDVKIKAESGESVSEDANPPLSPSTSTEPASTTVSTPSLESSILLPSTGDKTSLEVYPEKSPTAEPGETSTNGVALTAANSSEPSLG